MSGIGIVLNPYSKQHRKDPDKMKRMSYIVGDKGSCKTTTDLEDLRRVAEEFKTRDIDILAIAGGDGTIHVVLTAFVNVYGQKPLPKISLLRGGTMNTITNGINNRGTPEKLLANLIHKYHEDEPFESVEIDLMKVNEDYGFLYGCGLVYRFLEIYYKGTTPSPQKAFMLMVRATTSAFFNTKFTCDLFKRFDADVSVDGKPWAFKNYACIIAGCVPSLGLGTKVFYEAMKPGRFHAMGFSLTPRDLAMELPKLIRAQPSQHPGVMDSGFSDMKIAFKEPMPYFLDGDLLKPVSTMHISLGPRITIVK